VLVGRTPNLGFGGNVFAVFPTAVPGVGLSIVYIGNE
jgi:hypothetical protein